MTPNPRLYLPVELIEPIIKHAGRYSAQDLRSLSLVSKIWTPIAQSLLFSSVEIHTNFIHTSPAFFCGSDEYRVRRQLGGVPDPLFFTTGTHSQFHRLLEIAPHIPQYTRHLKFGSKRSHSFKNLLAFEAQGVIPSYLAMCTKLESLRCEFCSWDALQVIHGPLFAVLRACHQLRYLSLSCVTFKDVVSLVALLEGCASLETLVLEDVTVEPQDQVNTSVSTPFPSGMKASRPLPLHSFVLFNEELQSFSMILDALSVPSSPVDILHVRGLSLACPSFQSFESAVEATNSTLSVLRNLQCHTLEHLSLPVTIPLIELSSYTLMERLKSLRVSSRFLPPCISWLTQTLECGSLFELTVITIDIHDYANALFPPAFILEDRDKAAWRAFGAVLRNTSHVEIVRLYVDSFIDYPAQEDLQTLLAGEDRPVLSLLRASQ